ncbi:MAG: Lrp/AsnC ligand binding domain-containing protein [Candidatus Odinarchaeum yellowstonii]|uniref:Lrp/AsnC ligand binding domain-containing protein n=1 Tax=Odinarchaeota yellowstonii (strain LCB_4) TaxID=1841599 RepID=A0AAF0IBM1_ODILC|nr:MAG: Lrp/AsnC ligand binding domain-containing protein [Candidatus Odinarchaeum yellowstonii]
MAIVFMLVEVETGKIHDVLEKLKSIDGVKEYYAITGPYDIIARIVADDMEGIKSIIEKIQAIPGVTRTLSSITLPF